MAQHR